MKELKLKPSKSWRDSGKIFQHVEDGKLKNEKSRLSSPSVEGSPWPG